MEHLKYNTTTGWYVMKDDDIEDFSSIQVFMSKVAINNIEVKAWKRKKSTRGFSTLLNETLNYKTKII